MAIQFTLDDLPKPGTSVVFTKEGVEQQRFRLISSKPHECGDGTPSAVLKWGSHCTECGETYFFKSGLSTRAFYRRCKKCRKAFPRSFTGWPSGPKMRHTLEPVRPRQALEAVEDIDPASLF